MRIGTLLRRPLLILLVGLSLIAGGCTVAGPLSSLLVAAGSAASSSVPSASSAAPGPSTIATPATEPTPFASTPSAAHPTITGHLLAGPTCPVETVPPNPACKPRPVVGATVIATDVAGHEVARVVSDEAGYFWLALAAGTYRLTPQPTSDPMLRAPGSKVVSLGGGSPDTAVVDFLYDTGIR